ncbi:class I SAM-dependent DNA methyltransferase [Anaerocolumna sp. MB42-C2]|uniref:class I SAM-dependent DNA methyltransferase n=1 Tax=Anaerocolumna sp. MB42-C2 TaxID=3070997 RepID=UPI0027E10604|nr:class I SAM-dependent methyltransferase [Anaerocolumna sp. MB42-C2]WMJ86199.1 methyltransferase domain-containing protein [Anaerocolumna sp. MB42-C2]
MQAYSGFAQVYDIFMDNVPYDEWVDYLTSLLSEQGVKDGLVLELGCGTGNITRRLSGKGYDMIGVDLSDEMLEIAREKEYNADTDTDTDYINSVDVDTEKNQEQWNIDSAGSGYELESYQSGKNPILYLQQDMREFELYGTVCAVVSICDSMNYITSEEDLLKVFRLVNNYLDPGGIFIFDMNTEYKYKTILADNIIAENRDNCSFIWENYYHEENKINEYNMTIFVKYEYNPFIEDDEEAEEEDYDTARLFERFQETHYQKAYSIDKVIELINQAGLEFITVYDAFTKNKPTDKSERVYFIAREKYQENKKYISE